MCCYRRKNVRISADYPISEVISSASRVNTGSEIAEIMLIFAHFLARIRLFRPTRRGGFYRKCAVIGAKNAHISADYPISEVISSASRVNTGSEIAEIVLIFAHFFGKNTLILFNPPRWVLSEMCCYRRKKCSYFSRLSDKRSDKFRKPREYG